jgi:hypothetical protein
MTIICVGGLVGDAVGQAMTVTTQLEDVEYIVVKVEFGFEVGLKAAKFCIGQGDIKDALLESFSVG